MYLLGLDIGSSSIKAALYDADSRRLVAVVRSPEAEMAISAPQPGWAEQHPDTWWENVCLATRKILQTTGVAAADIRAIGIAYQMHGLVLVDKNRQVLRPSIIWCDSRAVAIGEKAFSELGREACLSRLLNAPGNFTAAKLGWVRENEPEVYAKIHQFMLPGDYIAMRLTGEINTTASGLSEGILWDFKTNTPAAAVLDYFGFRPEWVPDIVPAFSRQGELSAASAAATGLAPGTPVTYRAGDQPNNALALNVLEAGEVAATGGTSGVVYGVVDEPRFDPQSRINSFAHVNHAAEKPRIGMLLCINGAGIQYGWIKKNLAEEGRSYPEMEQLAAGIPIGSDGLRILPFGNGAERMLQNKMPGAQVNNLQLNRHGRPHFYRAALEGIAFSFVYGMKILEEMGLNVNVIRAGNDNLFQSAVFSSTIAHLMGNRIELIETTGAAGAAQASGVGAGIYATIRDAVQAGQTVRTYAPESPIAPYESAYAAWLRDLEQRLSQTG